MLWCLHKLPYSLLARSKILTFLYLHPTLMLQPFYFPRVFSHVLAQLHVQKPLVFFNPIEAYEQICQTKSYWQKSANLSNHQPENAETSRVSWFRTPLVALLLEPDGRWAANGHGINHPCNFSGHFDCDSYFPSLICNILQDAGLSILFLRHIYINK